MREMGDWHSGCLESLPWRQQNSNEREVKQMINKIRNDRSAFTLVEIMIVVAIIGLLAALAIPGFSKPASSHKVAAFSMIAVRWTPPLTSGHLRPGQTDGNAINTTGAQTYLKTAWKTLDLLNNTYATTVVGTTQISINAATKTALAGVGIDWGIY